MIIPGFVGGSYELNQRSADMQRSIGLYPTLVESGSGKVPSRMKSIPGLTEFADLGAEIRGMYQINGLLYAVAGGTLYQVSSTGLGTSFGSLVTTTGVVDIAANSTQLVIVDGPYGYTKDIPAGMLTRITSAAFYGSTRVGILDGYAIFIRPDTGQFYITSINDAQTLDGSDYATAEGSPDNLVSLIVDHREAWLFGTDTIEIWVDSPSGPDFPLERMQSSFIEVGCGAAQSPAKIDETVFWLSKEGTAWMAEGYRPRPISDEGIGRKLQALSDLSGARGFALRIDGHPMYVLRVPGLSTTLAYDISTQKWHEWAELVDGEYEQHRATCYAFAFGKHLVGAADGKIYQMDPTANTNAGDPLVRDRIFSQAPKDPGWQFYSNLEIECDTGIGLPDGSAPQLQMRYSDDFGATFKQFRTASLGSIGERSARAVFGKSGLGRSREGRVWHIRMTDDTPFSASRASVVAE